MSKSSNDPPVERFQFPNSRRLWHDGTGLTKSLGCQQCAFEDVCGGLQVEAHVFDCLTYCRCSDPATCDNVCPRNVVHLVARSQEVGGFDLMRVQSAPVVVARAMPIIAPMIYHISSRGRAPRTAAVALSLYQMIDRKGLPRFGTRSALLKHFKLADDTIIVLNGTDHDPPLERWWKLEHRQEVTRNLAGLGVDLITTPNYSLFDDVPRPDNFYNMKRIALIWSEMQREGVVCALHLNARTDRDWERWVHFLNARPEIAHVAFEFATGAGSRLRIKWHVQQLCALAAAVKQPLHLMVRGGFGELAPLHKAFGGLTVIETNAFMKSQKRRRAILRDGRLTWEPAPTLAGATIDELFDENIGTMRAHIENEIGGDEAPVSALSKSA